MGRKMWHLGNTTVRSPFRLREGLRVLSTSNLQGKLRGEEADIAFRELLGKNGIVELGSDRTNSVSRKWRAAMTQLGFLTPLIPKSHKVNQAAIGPADYISENGQRLIASETVPAMQECFLRSLAAYSIPNPTEPNYEFPPFSPLKHTLAVMLALESSTGENRLSFAEMAFFVQTSSAADDMSKILNNILSYREARATAQNKKAFDNAIRERLSRDLDYIDTTFDDYADTTIRYLKATGLVVATGRGIAIFSDRRDLVERLVQDDKIPQNAEAYYKAITTGLVLPTDELEGARAIYQALRDQAIERDIEPIQPSSFDSVADINVARHKIEERLFIANELDFAKRQNSMVGEISLYLDLIITNPRPSHSTEEGRLYIPSSERPAYLEWILWRAFLAMNKLINPPYESRRFKIDQAFLPIGTASGNGPDLQFEYETFALIVEATLTESSRQEAVEGESVRRHVANAVKSYNGKPTYGLFVANKVDTNTVQTFKIAVWYIGDDNEMKLAIVPMSLLQFKSLFLSVVKLPQDERPIAIRKFLDECLESKEVSTAPQWKANIERCVSKLPL